jgi:hypothetical protein
MNQRKTIIESQEASHRDLLEAVARNLRLKARILLREKHFLGESCDDLAQTIETYLSKITKTCECCGSKDLDRATFRCSACNDSIAVCNDCKSIVGSCSCGHCVDGATFHEE